MKKLLVSVLLLPVLALAQEPVIVEKKVVCNWTKNIIDNLVEKYKETPIWMGMGADGTSFSLFADEKGSWTLLQFNKDIACIIGAGDKGQPLDLLPKI